MDNKDNKSQVPQQEPKKKPDELSGIQVDEFVKIFDPNSSEVFVAKRGES
jgi:hypothetical protein